jgi:hypothetical protein
MLAAREDLVDQVSELSSRRGLTLFGVTNDALEHILKLDKMGVRQGEVVREYEVSRATRDSGFVPIPEMLLYEVMDRAYVENRDWMMKKWNECGEWCGKYCSVKGFGSDLGELEKYLKGFLWNANDFDLIQGSPNDVFVKCVSPRFSESYVSFLGAFLEGLFSALGYELAQKDLSKGILELQFRIAKKV